MKKILFSLFFLHSLCFAQDFSLTFEKEKFIKYNSNDWQLAAQTTQFDLYINKLSIGTTDKVPAIHSLVEFYDPNGVKFEPLLKLADPGHFKFKDIIYKL